jgi:hypothetical protein
VSASSDVVVARRECGKYRIGEWAVSSAQRVRVGSVSHSVRVGGLRVAHRCCVVVPGAPQWDLWHPLLVPLAPLSGASGTLVWSLWHHGMIGWEGFG